MWGPLGDWGCTLWQMKDQDPLIQTKLQDQFTDNIFIFCSQMRTVYDRQMHWFQYQGWGREGGQTWCFMSWKSGSSLKYLQTKLQFWLRWRLLNGQVKSEKEKGLIRIILASYPGISLHLLCPYQRERDHLVNFFFHSPVCYKVLLTSKSGKAPLEFRSVTRH